jgi:hypothetical protein
VPRVGPYVRYQEWDQAADLSAGHRWGHVTLGTTLALAERSSFLRLEYEAAVSRPAGAPKEDHRLLLRLQIQT